MTPGELIAAVEHADATQPRGRRRIILHLVTPTVLGFRGRPMRGPDGTVTYGYTRRDARAMVQRIYAAAREDAGLDADEPE